MLIQANFAAGGDCYPRGSTVMSSMTTIAPAPSRKPDPGRRASSGRPTQFGVALFEGLFVTREPWL
jgi:hypothetical protein